MRPLARIIFLLVISLVSLFAPTPVLAIPTLPSSLYGTVKVNDVNVPDGTLIKALINGQIYAEVQTQIYLGDSVYSLIIPGDNPDTSIVEGGRDNDTIVFIIGETVADQNGTWRSGTTTNLNLSASNGGPPIVPQETFTPTPSQTATISVTKTSPALTIVPPNQSTGIPATGTRLPTVLKQPTATIPTENTPANGNKTSMVIVIILAGSILIFILWFIFIRKQK